VCITALPRLAAAGDLTQDNPEGLRSPQSWAVELRLGPYHPDVDSEFSGGQHPYNDFYGSGTDILTAIEVDYQLWHRFGSIGVGISAGYFNDTAHACAPGGCQQPRSGADESGFNLVPVNFLAVYRFDVPAVRWNVPLVPYFKLGLAYDFWWFTNGAGEVPHLGGGKDVGRGATAGYTVAGGLSLLLDWLDQGSAVTADSELGLNHTYLFFEVFHSGVNGLGSSDKLHVGDSTWSMGLAFEF
jgi:hypothetical protein